MQIHELLLHILPVVIFSFIIGLEVRAYLTKFHENDARVFLELQELMLFWEF